VFTGHKKEQVSCIKMAIMI